MSAKATPIRARAIPPATPEAIGSQVLLLRGQRVLLARQLAALYGVETRTLNQAVKRNLARLPADFMFQVELEEIENLRSQFVILNESGVAIDDISRSQFVILKQGSNIKYLPYAFTEQGIAMLSSVLKSERAIAVNIEIMRTFIKLRSILTEHHDLKRQLALLKGKCDARFRMMFDAIRALMSPEPAKKRPRIGFVLEGN